mmetsp:Transcript_33309/g.73391  ORF Transcript_33309/g.73391 Transcript_33309/m.73391 type:complete len:108 (-) Transcript_33309:1023-1346(-)
MAAADGASTGREIKPNMASISALLDADSDITQYSDFAFVDCFPWDGEGPRSLCSRARPMPCTAAAGASMSCDIRPCEGEAEGLLEVMARRIVVQTSANAWLHLAFRI